MAKEPRQRVSAREAAWQALAEQMKRIAARKARLAARPDLGGRPRNEEVRLRRKAIARLVDRGHKPGKIAAELGVPAATVYQDIARIKKARRLGKNLTKPVPAKSTRKKS